MDPTRPVLLFVHGGPGSTLMPFSRAFDGDLLEHFTVVHWDQRGAGKSYAAEADPKHLTLQQIADDGLVVAAEIGRRFPGAPLYLVGHSWGTVVATTMARARPAAFRGLVLVGTVVDMRAGDEAKVAFLRARAAAAHDAGAQARLDRLPAPPFARFEDAVAVSHELMAHGAVLHGLTPEQMGEAARQTREYSDADFAATEAGMRTSIERLMPALATYRAIDAAPEIPVPVLFVQGAHDMATPTPLARSYFDALMAPRGKAWALFENAAHFAMYEDRRGFAARVLRWSKEVHP